MEVSSYNDRGRTRRDVPPIPTRGSLAMSGDNWSVTFSGRDCYGRNWTLRITSSEATDVIRNIAWAMPEAIHAALDNPGARAKGLDRIYLDPLAPPEDVIQEIAAERRRQVKVKGWTSTHDDEHGDGEMAQAAATYAVLAMTKIMHEESPVIGRLAAAIKWLWPWSPVWLKRDNTARRMLVKAGALIVAEIERIDRAEKARTGQI
jgi:hypothetical protein